MAKSAKNAAAPVPVKRGAAPPKPKSEAKPQKTLSASLVAALPDSKQVMASVQTIEKHLPAIIKQMEASRKEGSIVLARAFVVLHRMCARMEEAIKPYKQTLDVYKQQVIPEQFEQAGVPNVNLDEGFRVGISSRILASIIPDKKQEAYEWLRNNGLGDIIGETVNASTLSATAKSLIEDKNQELPEDMFRVAYVPTTSVTQTPSK